MSYYEALREQCICRHGCCFHCYLLFLRAPAFDTGGETKCHKSAGTESTSWICEFAHAGDVCAFASGAAERAKYKAKIKFINENFKAEDPFDKKTMLDDDLLKALEWGAVRSEEQVMIRCGCFPQDLVALNVVSVGNG